MTFRTDNPMIDPAEVDKFYGDDAPPIRGTITLFVTVPVLIAVDAEKMPNHRPSDPPIKSEQDAIDAVTDDALEYVCLAIGRRIRHMAAVGSNSTLQHIDPDLSGIKIDNDATEFSAH